MGVFEVDMFSKDVDTLDHPDVRQFKKVLLETAEEYDCFLTSFDITEGIVTFSFNSEELTSKILKILQNDHIR